MKRVAVLALVAALLLAMVPSTLAAPPEEPKPLRVKVVAPGGVFCPAAALVFGRIIITSGRCYTIFLMRETRGSFLVFTAPGAKIPPGQLVRLNTPAGAKIKGRMFYSVPLARAAVWMPMNTMTPVAVRVEDFGPRLALVLADRPGVNIVFTVRP